MADTYTHPDTGDNVEIPEGAEVVKNDQGEVLYWRLPPQYTGTEVHPDRTEGYNAKFERAGFERRVLQTVTNGDNRNTEEAVAAWISDDENYPGKWEPGHVGEALGKLAEAGLVEKRADDTYGVTDAGRTELIN